MKNLSKLMIGAGLAMAITSCTSEAPVPANSGDITVTVKTEDLVNTRALSTPEGYELKCVMQLLNDGNTQVGTQDIQPATGGAASFTIKAADIDDGASKALFWAEYVPTGNTDKVYDSSDLTNITYKITEFDASNANLIAACDAFAGTITTLTNGASVTLTRPMIQLTITPTNPEVAAAATSLKVEYSTPTGYNVLTKNCTADATEEVTYNNTAFQPTAGDWFMAYVLAPANLSKLDSEITMTISGGFEKVANIPTNQFPLDANYMVKGSFELDATPGTQDVDVNVTIDGSFENEPKPAQFEVGAYLTAAGVPTNEVSEAVAVVYYVGAMETYYGTDEISFYPQEYNGKTIKGYAVALENAGARQNLSTDATYSLTTSERAINGSIYTNTIKEHELLGSGPMFTQFEGFCSSNPLSAVGNTTTDWYIPATPQLQWWLSKMVSFSQPIGGEAGAAYMYDAVDPVMQKLFPHSNLYDRDTFKSCKYVSCTTNTNNYISGCQLADNTPDSPTVPTGSFSQFSSGTNPAVVRPMFTVFE